MPPRLRVLGLLDQGLLWGNLGVSLLVLVAEPTSSPRSRCRRRSSRSVIGGLIGNAMLGARHDRRRRARAGDGADAGAARPARFLGADGAECGAVRRLGDLRAADHRDRGRGPVRRALRLPRAVALDDLGGVALALALLGPIGFVRKFVRKFAVWAVLASPST